MNFFNFTGKRRLDKFFCNPALNLHSKHNIALESKTKWNGIIHEAEKVVGYPTSFLNLRWLLNDEIANVALHVRKLIGTDHPILDIAKKFFLQNEFPKWGLIVLLFSKMAGYKSNILELEMDATAGVLHSQRVLAEVTEMIRTTYHLHQGLLNDISPEISDNYADLNFGNKLALLSGDYLLSRSFRELALIKNHDVNEILSSTLRDLTQAQFLGPFDNQNMPLPCKPVKDKNLEVPDDITLNPLDSYELLGNAKSEWILRNLLGGASLLAKSCQATLILAEHNELLQKEGHVFGKNLALAYQAKTEIELFKDENKAPLSLISAPVLFHLQDDPAFYQCFENEVNYEHVKNVVNNGLGVEKTYELCEELCGKALKSLDMFQENESKMFLSKIVKALR